jgi:excisionase family DNA binding protein
MNNDAELGGYALAEQVTGLPRGSIYSLVHAKEIPHIRISRRTVRFRRADLERWLEAHSVAVTTEPSK